MSQTIPLADDKYNYTRLEALEWMCQTAAALTYLHDIKPRPIIHRDLKPANILLKCDRGHVILADFGIATAWRTSMTHGHVGTGPYIAPEVCDCR